MPGSGKDARLFTAVELPAAVKALLLSLHTDIAGLRWTSPENLHLTLRFIGETPGETLPEVKMALRSVCVPGFYSCIKGLGLFERSEQTILWAGLKPCPELANLKRHIDAALSTGAHLASDKGRFSPHITLGRLRGPAPEALHRLVQTHRDVTAEIPIVAFTLFSSLLAPGGAVHHPEEVYPLA